MKYKLPGRGARPCITMRPERQNVLYEYKKYTPTRARSEVVHGDVLSSEACDASRNCEPPSAGADRKWLCNPSGKAYSTNIKYTPPERGGKTARGDTV